MKRLLLIIFFIAIMNLFTGCSKITNYNWKSNEKIKVGVCISDYNDVFRHYLLNEMKNYSKNLENVEVTYVDSKKNFNIQLSQVENFVSEGEDVIIVNPVYTNLTDLIGEKAKAANIPVITLLSSFNNENDPLSYINSDLKQSGALVMEYIAKKMNYKGNVAILMGPAGDDAQRIRTEAFREVIGKYPNMKVVSEESADWDRARGRAVMENWIDSKMQIDAVVSNNDEMAIGAADAIESAGKSNQIIVGSIDATPDALQYLKNGKIDATVYQDAFALAKISLDTAVKAAEGKSVEKTIKIPNELVTPDNVDKYIIRWNNK